MKRRGGYFISYARADEQTAVRIYETLATAGEEAWLDIANLRPGLDWWETVKRAIDQCVAVLLLVSDESTRSMSCSLELAYAAVRGKQVHPIAQIAPTTAPWPFGAAKSREPAEESPISAAKHRHTAPVRVGIPAQCHELPHLGSSVTVSGNRLGLTRLEATMHPPRISLGAPGSSSAYPRIPSRAGARNWRALRPRAA